MALASTSCCGQRRSGAVVERFEYPTVPISTMVGVTNTTAVTSTMITAVVRELPPEVCSGVLVDRPAISIVFRVR